MQRQFTTAFIILLTHIIIIIFIIIEESVQEAVWKVTRNPSPKSMTSLTFGLITDGDQSIRKWSNL